MICFFNLTEPISSQYIKAKIRQFEKRFNNLKRATRECLVKQKVSVRRVADTLMSLPADDIGEHKQFLESHISALYQSLDHSELFGIMNPKWNYLSYHLLDILVRRFELEEVKGEMAAYKEDLQHFREETPLTLFCQTQKKRRVRLDPKFQEVVAEFDWPAEVTLEVVEQFRQEYAGHHDLRECAMMLAEVGPGSFIDTSYHPSSGATATPGCVYMNCTVNHCVRIYNNYTLCFIPDLPYISHRKLIPSVLKGHWKCKNIPLLMTLMKTSFVQ